MFPLKIVARKELNYNMTGPLIHPHPSQFTFWNIYFTIYASIENTQKCMCMKNKPTIIVFINPWPITYPKQ